MEVLVTVSLVVRVDTKDPLMPHPASCLSTGSLHRVPIPPLAPLTLCVASPDLLSSHVMTLFSMKTFELKELEAKA